MDSKGNVKNAISQASQLTVFAHSNLHAMANYEQKDL